MLSKFGTEASFSIFAKSRPHKIAFLIDPQNLPNKLLNAIFEHNITSWGGRYNPIIPCNGKEISDEYWSLLVFSDPDIVYSYIDLDDGLVEKIDREISPFYLLGANQQLLKKGSYRVSISPGVLSNEELLNNLPKFKRPWHFDERCSIAIFKIQEDWENYDFILRNFGFFQHALGVFMKAKDTEWTIELAQKMEGINTFEIDGRENLSDILLKLSKNRAVIYPIQISEDPGSYSRGSYEEEDRDFLLAVGDNILNVLYTWNRIHVLNQVQRKQISQMWIPDLLLHNEGFMSALREFINYYLQIQNQPLPRLILVSYDKPRKELEEIATIFQKDLHCRVDIRSSSENAVLPFIKSKPEWFSVPNKLRELFRVNGRNVFIPNRPPLPVGYRGRFYSAAWMLDLNISYRPEQFSYTNAEYCWNLPRRPGISYLFVKHPSRINKYGAISVEAKTNDHNIEITIPDDIDVFHQLICGFYDYHYTNDLRKKKERIYGHIRYSEKGKYLSGVIGLFPSLWHANHCFENRYWRGIFEYLSHVSVGKESKLFSEITNKVEKGLKLLGQDFQNDIERAKEFFSNYLLSKLRKVKYDDEVDFNFFCRHLQKEREEFRKKYDLGNSFEYTEKDLKNDLYQALQQLTESEIILQGIRPKCGGCGYKNWYSIDEVKSDLICKGCHTPFKFPVEEKWFYKLNELIRNTILHQGVMATLLCLGHIFHNSRLSFIYSPNLLLFKKYGDKTPDYELDIICISNGRFIIGEVKNSAKLFRKSDFTKMEDVAIKLRPDKVIMYAMKGPYDRVITLTKELKKKLQPFGIETEFIHASDRLEEPEFHANPF